MSIPGFIGDAIGIRDKLLLQAMKVSPKTGIQELCFRINSLWKTCFDGEYDEDI